MHAPLDSAELTIVTFANNDEDKMNEDLVKFLQGMQEKLSADITRGNDNLKKEINYCRKELKEDITAIHLKVEELKTDVEKNKSETNVRLGRMESRIVMFEKEQVKLGEEKKKREEIVARGIEAEKGDTTVKAPINYSEAVKMTDKPIEVTEELVPSFKSSWARMMSQQSLEQQLKAATLAAGQARVEGQTKPAERKVDVKKKETNSGGLRRSTPGGRLVLGGWSRGMGWH